MGQGRLNQQPGHVAQSAGVHGMHELRHLTRFWGSN